MGLSLIRRPSSRPETLKSESSSGSDEVMATDHAININLAIWVRIVSLTPPLFPHVNNRILATVIPRNVLVVS